MIAAKIFFTLAGISTVATTIAALTAPDSPSERQLMWIGAFAIATGTFLMSSMIALVWSI